MSLLNTTQLYSIVARSVIIPSRCTHLGSQSTKITTMQTCSEPSGRPSLLCLRDVPHMSLVSKYIAHPWIRDVIQYLLHMLGLLAQAMPLLLCLHHHRSS